MRNSMDAKVLTSNPLVKSFLSGSASGTCSLILFQPFDLIKTRIQIARTSLSVPGIASKSGIAMQSSMYNVIKSVIRNESIKGLWKGFSPSFLRCVPGVGLYFTSLQFLTTKLYKNKKPTALECVFLGAGARTFTTGCMLPMTVIKTRFESGKFKYKSVWQALFDIYHKEGTRGLYRGVSATLLRDAPFSGLYLMLYTTTKRLYSGGDSVNNFACATAAGIFASFATQPADVVKTKMQISQSSTNFTHIVGYIYKKQGIVGFFSGIAPRATRRTLMAAATWTVYEYLNRSQS